MRRRTSGNVRKNDKPKTERQSKSMKNQDWWKAPEDGDEYHTARVWAQIAKAAAAAGDTSRATEASEAADTETRNCGAA